MDVQIVKQPAGTFRLTILDENGHVDEIIEASFRDIITRLLKLENPETKLAIRKVK